MPVRLTARTHASIAALAASLLISDTACAATAEELAQPCAQCHGANGVAAAPGTPHLDGQLMGYLEQEISALASGERKTDVADHVAKTWSKADISAVAKLYAKTRAVRPKQEIDAQLAAKGMELYRQRCADCHADNGRLSDKDAPLMAAQNLAYMSAQTKLFVSGKRRFPFMMDDAYKGLNAEQLESISHFFASQEQARPRK